MKYRKLTNLVQLEGVGIHSGKYSRIVLKPTEKRNNGINFVKDNKVLPLDIKYVVDTSRATTIANNDIKISTVEHLLSTIYCLYLTDIDIYIYGEEIPAMDGSSRMFVEKILSSGIEDTDEEIQFYKINTISKFQINHSKFEILPEKEFIITCELDNTPSKIVNNKKVTVKITPENYTKQIAYAKTFCYFEDIKNIQSNGYGLGGSLDNVVIIDKDKILNPEILTYKEDEFVRHKILDFLGDLSFTKTYFCGKFNIKNPSHSTNIEFCKKLLEYIFEDR